MSKHISRRNFLRTSSCAAIGTTTLFSTLTNLKFMNAASIANSSTILGGDYKALVCILLAGGNDSHNMLIPREQNEYQHYATSRSQVAIPRDSILSLNGSNYGLHPAMTAAQQLYNNNELSFISNIGTLIGPTDKPSALNEENLPVGLFSHSDQRQQWQTSVPHDRSSVGWGGRIADMMNDLNDNPNISMNVSLSGTNIFQTGQSTIEYSIDRNQGSTGILGYDASNTFLSLRNQALDNIVDAHYDDLFKKTYIDVIKNSRDASLIVSEALAEAPFVDDLFVSDTNLSDSLRMISRMIASRDRLGARRQIFFVNVGGWDNHDDLLSQHTLLLDELSEGLSEFNAALKRVGAHDCVTTFTSSDFGRTLTYNGEGTDHAWGGNVMVMGGPVKGGNIYGDYPLLELAGEFELSNNPMYSNGIMIPTTSVDEYFAELALWFGVAPSELSTIFPNIGNFYNTSGGAMPIGFIG